MLNMLKVDRSYKRTKKELSNDELSWFLDKRVKEDLGVIMPRTLNYIRDNTGKYLDSKL